MTERAVRARIESLKVHHKTRNTAIAVFFFFGAPKGNELPSRSVREVRIPLAVSASRGGESIATTKANEYHFSYPEQHTPEGKSIALQSLEFDN